MVKPLLFRPHMLEWLVIVKTTMGVRWGDVLEPPLRGTCGKPENGKEPEMERAANAYKQIG